MMHLYPNAIIEVFDTTLADQSADTSASHALLHDEYIPFILVLVHSSVGKRKPIWLVPSSAFLLTKEFCCTKLCFLMALAPNCVLNMKDPEAKKVGIFLKNAEGPLKNFSESHTYIWHTWSPTFQIGFQKKFARRSRFSLRE